jgi:hypothetical protein
MIAIAISVTSYAPYVALLCPSTRRDAVKVVSTDLREDAVRANGRAFSDLFTDGHHQMPLPRASPFRAGDGFQMRA